MRIFRMSDMWFIAHETSDILMNHQMVNQLSNRGEAIMVNWTQSWFIFRNYLVLSESGRLDGRCWWGPYFYYQSYKIPKIVLCFTKLWFIWLFSFHLPSIISITVARLWCSPEVLPAQNSMEAWMGHSLKVPAVLL